MPKPIVIDKTHARRFVLAHLHLLPPRQLPGKQGALDYIRRVNCIQYDPINIVGQNPHLVLQSRVAGYKPAMLDELLYTDRKLVDGFDKQMAIYPVEDWPYFTYYRQQRAQLHMQDAQTAEAAKLVEPVRMEIETRGPLSSIDLEDDTRMDWWLAGSVRAVRIAMDILLYSGETLVHHRVGTRRHFDLSSRLLPAEIYNANHLHASQEAYLDWHVLRRVGGIGLLSPNTGAEFGGIVGWRGGKIRDAVNRLVNAGQLIPVQVQGLDRKTFFVRHDHLAALESAGQATVETPGAAFIAPLDNLMWDRNMVSLLFDYAYTWEVYVPAPKRQYGYYVLPVLYGDRMVGRVDPNFDRDSKSLVVKNWWWEAGVDPQDEAILAAVSACLRDFARYLDAADIRLSDAVSDRAELVMATAAANRAL